MQISNAETMQLNKIYRNEHYIRQHEAITKEMEMRKKGLDLIIAYQAEAINRLKALNLVEQAQKTEYTIAREQEATEMMRIIGVESKKHQMEVCNAQAEAVKSHNLARYFQGLADHFDSQIPRTGDVINFTITPIGEDPTQGGAVLLPANNVVAPVSNVITPSSEEDSTTSSSHGDGDGVSCGDTIDSDRDNVKHPLP